jgi:hypothetical protein
LLLFGLVLEDLKSILSPTPPVIMLLVGFCYYASGGFLLRSVFFNLRSVEICLLPSSACLCSGNFFSCLLVCAAGLRSSDYFLGRPLCLGLYFSLALLRLSLFCSRLASLASAIMLSRTCTGRAD